MKKKKGDTQRTHQWLLDVGDNIEQGSGWYKLLDIRQAQGCIVQHWEYSQYFAIIVNGNKTLKY